MAELPNKWPTLLDVTRAQDPNGAIAAVAEILTETNELLVDLPFFEGNLPTGHRHTVRTGIPEPTWRQFYGGVQPKKSARAQVQDNTAMMESYGEVDKALADLNGNASAFRLSEDYAIMEGMSQAAAQAFIYGNVAVDPTQFNGLTPRFNLKSADNGENIIDAGGQDADNASIWLVVLGEQTVHGIYPKGSNGGLQMKDLGEVTIENVDGNQGRMQAYRTHYRWDMGLVVKDWRYVVRIANIKRAALRHDAATGPDIPRLLFEASERLPSLSMGTPFIYMDRQLRTTLRQQLAYATKSSTLEWSNVGGIRTMMYQEMPIRRLDKLAVNEARVV
jgi:hypothetical protein